MTSDPFRGAGALADAYAAVDWSATPLGPVDTWSPTLVNAVDLILSSRFPMTLVWGRDLVLVYNAAYVESIADKHPWALGRRCEDVFPEAWDVVGPLLTSVLDGAPATWETDALIPLHRSGFLEEVHFTFSYSPVHGPDGSVEGVLDIAAETTPRVVLGRRLELLGRLSRVLAGVRRPEELLARAHEVLRAAADDLAMVELVLAVEDAPASPSDVLALPLGRFRSGTAELRVRPHPMLPLDERHLDFLNLVAASLRRTLDRLATLADERSVSEALQLSLLGHAPPAAGMQVAVRYQPAAELAQVGGDWYDAFPTEDGATVLVVGDVAGHDQQSAAAMAQIRNLLRAVTYGRTSSPAEVLTGLDVAMAGLDVGVVATAVVAAASPTPQGLTVTWASAGHPPPVLLRRDGTATLLEEDTDLLLGLDPDGPRRDRSADLADGETLLLYTDGLVERRGLGIEDGLADLVAQVAGHQHGTAEDLCSHVLELAGDLHEDDIALLAVRADLAAG